MKKILSIAVIVLIALPIFLAFPMVMGYPETWYSTTPLPHLSYANPSVVHDDKIYIVGGQTPTGGIRYDTVLYGSVRPDGHIDHYGWLFTKPLPEERTNPGVVVYGDWIYVLGGSANQPGWIERDTVWNASFNPDGTIGRWRETTRLPYHGDKVTVEWNGRIYIMAGWDGGSMHDDVYYAEISQADGSLGNWVKTTSLPEPIAHNHAAVVHNGVIYVIGGTLPGAPPIYKNEVYYATIEGSGAVGTWTETAPLPVGIQGHSVVTYGCDSIFVIGGDMGSGVYSDIVYRAHISPDGSLDSWQEWGRLPERLFKHSSVVLNERVYVIGGRREDGSLADTVYFVSLPPPVEDTEAYIEYVNQTIQDLPDEIFSKPDEDVPDIKNDFSDLFNDTLENINEGNYEGAIEKLNRIRTMIYEEIVESAERQEIISLIDDLIEYLETLL